MQIKGSDQSIPFVSSKDILNVLMRHITDPHTHSLTHTHTHTHTHTFTHTHSHTHTHTHSKVMQDYRLLYVMAVNHPALSFNQRQLLMYNYLQRMDLVFVEKSKYSFSGSFSGSVEVRDLCCLSVLYPHCGHHRDVMS